MDEKINQLEVTAPIQIIPKSDFLQLWVFDFTRKPTYAPACAAVWSPDQWL